MILLKRYCRLRLSSLSAEVMIVETMETRREIQIGIMGTGKEGLRVAIVPPKVTFSVALECPVSFSVLQFPLRKLGDETGRSRKEGKWTDWTMDVGEVGGNTQELFCTVFAHTWSSGKKKGKK